MLHPPTPQHGVGSVQSWQIKLRVMGSCCDTQHDNILSKKITEIGRESLLRSIFTYQDPRYIRRGVFHKSNMQGISVPQIAWIAPCRRRCDARCYSSMSDTLGLSVPATLRTPLVRTKEGNSNWSRIRLFSAINTLLSPIQRNTKDCPRYLCQTPSTRPPAFRPN